MQDAKWILFLLPTLFFISCSSTKTAKESAENRTPVALAFATDRQLTLEPCGCSFNPLGGLEAEYHFLQSARQKNPELLYVNYGTTFLDLSVKKKRGFTEKQKAKTLVTALNVMEVRALGPSGDDLSLPIAELKQLKNESLFPWIATNVQHPMLSPSLSIQRGEKTLHFFHLVNKPTTTAFKWEEPIAALKKELARLPKDQNQVVIVLSSLSHEGEIKLQEFSKEIHILAAHKSPEFMEGITYLSPSAVAIQPMEMGKKIVELNLSIPKILTNFYNTPSAEYNSKHIAEWQNALKETGRNVAESAGAIESNLQYASRVPVAFSDQSALLEEASTLINRKWYLGENIVSVILENHRSAMHAKALKE